MNIAILGTRGIPNHYGGFEQFAEYLSLGLVKEGYQVTVYNSHTHPYQKTEWKGVSIVHCKDPEDKIGTAGQFIYDLNCIRDIRKKKFDIILQLGYTSSSVWGWLLPRKKSIVITNMDGLEWKRTKYSNKVQKFLKLAEKLGIKYSDYLVADSLGIQNYIKQKYNKESTYIPYGAHIFNTPDDSYLKEYKVFKYQYNMLISRMEPENNIEVILDAIPITEEAHPFLVIGKYENKFGKYVKEKFKNNKNIRFLGGIYDITVLNNLRYFSNIYFHGHTVGGTNPSLLEAMSSQALICAHDNIFNRSILEEEAFYFKNTEDIKKIITVVNKENFTKTVDKNLEKIKQLYNWDFITNQYIDLFKSNLRN